MNQLPAYQKINSDTDAALYNNLGVNKCESGQFDEGIANFSRAIQFKPKISIPYLNRAIAFFHLSMPHAAKADIEAAQVLQHERDLLTQFGMLPPEVLEAVNKAFDPRKK